MVNGERYSGESGVLEEIIREERREVAGHCRNNDRCMSAVYQKWKLKLTRGDGSTSDTGRTQEVGESYLVSWCTLWASRLTSSDTNGSSLSRSISETTSIVLGSGRSKVDDDTSLLI